MPYEGAKDGKQYWLTPPELMAELEAEFHFDFDPCPNWASNFALRDFNGLWIEWGERNFVNPPYGKQVPLWVKKGYEESQKGKLVVMLVASRTDTRWWHDYIMKAREIRFIKGRLWFDERGPAPFPSAIVVFKEEPDATTRD